jgi:MFS family permease
MTDVSEFRRGWPIVATAMIGAAVGVSSITLYTAGLFVAPLEAEFHWSRAAIASAGIMATGGIAIASPLTGQAIDRYGARPVALIALLMTALCFVALGLMPGSLMAFLGITLLIGVLGAGSSPISFTRVVNAWFNRSRGLALGITLMGGGFVGFLAPLLLGPVIQSYGWRSGYFAIAAVVAISAPLVWFFLRDPEAREDQRAAAVTHEGVEFRDAMRSRALWIMGVSYLLAAAAITGTVIHFVPILISAGDAPPVAVKTASVLGLAVILSRLGIGYALDRLFAPWVAATALVGAAAGCLLLRAFGADWAVAAGFLVGVVLGTESDVVAYMTSRYFGLKAYARIYGVLIALYLISSGLGAPLYGAIFDQSHSYAPALALGSVLLLLSAGLMALMPRYPAASRSEFLAVESGAEAGA